MTTKDSTKSNPEYQSRELKAATGELQKCVWEMMDMKDVLKTNVLEASTEMGDLTPAGQKVMFEVFDRLLSKQLEMVEYIQGVLNIDNVDWDDLHLPTLEDKFETVSRENVELNIKEARS